MVVEGSEDEAGEDVGVGASEGVVALGVGVGVDLGEEEVGGLTTDKYFNLMLDMIDLEAYIWECSCLKRETLEADILESSCLKR